MNDEQRELPIDFNVHCPECHSSYQRMLRPFDRTRDGRRQCKGCGHEYSVMESLAMTVIRVGEYASTPLGDAPTGSPAVDNEMPKEVAEVIAECRELPKISSYGPVQAIRWLADQNARLVEALRKIAALRGDGDPYGFSYDIAEAALQPPTTGVSQ